MDPQTVLLAETLLACFVALSSAVVGVALLPWSRDDMLVCERALTSLVRRAVPAHA